jgi:hypothetical protein
MLARRLPNFQRELVVPHHTEVFRKFMSKLAHEGFLVSGVMRDECERLLALRASTRVLSIADGQVIALRENLGYKRGSILRR